MSHDLLPALFSALLLGLISSGHCLGMCGGIACALGLQQHKTSTLALLTYHAGRISTYAILALLFGATLQHLTHRAPLLAPVLRTIAGLLLLAMALHIAQWWSGITRLEQLGTRWWKPLQQCVKPLLPADSFPKIFALGLLWGWLPCALVYSTLAWCASRANGAEAALLMIFFGIGTTPALLASGVLSARLRIIFQHKHWRLAVALLLGVYALWTITAGWQHASHH